MAGRLQWRTMLREALAVLAAILVAFALDAWWSQQAQRRESRAVLSVLSLELEGNVEDLDSITVVNEDALAAMRFQLGLSPDDVRNIECDALADFSQKQRVVATFVPEMGALNALLMSGQLGDIESTDLRSSVAGLPGAFAELDGWEALLLGNSADLVRSLMTRLFRAPVRRSTPFPPTTVKPDDSSG